MARLDLQRLPGHYHQRPNSRTYKRGYDTLPHAVWGDSFASPAPPAPVKGQSKPGDTFPAEATVTASDATNAAKLTALGYIAVPLTAWTTGQKITVGTFDFNWSGTAWAAGAHA